MILEELFDDRFARVVRWSAEGRASEMLDALETAAHDEGPVPEDTDLEMIAWARLPPRLATVDLGQYLRLAATLKQLSMHDSDLRPDLADVLEGLVSTSESLRKSSVARASSLEVVDRVVLASRLAHVTATQPNRQAAAAESLASLARTDTAVAAEARAQLWGMDPKQIKPATPVWFGEAPIPVPIRELLAHWKEQLGESAVGKVIEKRLAGEA